MINHTRSNDIGRRSYLLASGAACLSALAGCVGGIGGGSNGGDSLLLDGPVADWEKPKPMAQRIVGDTWTAPEFNDENVADEISYFNLGSMKNDPATAWWHDLLEKKTGIKTTPITVPSKNATSKITTVLSGQSDSPAFMQVDWQMYMDFVEPGYFEPVDQIWSKDVYEYFPPAFKENYVTGVDNTLEGAHNYMSVAIAEGSFQNYRPNFLEELGFDRDFLKRPTWADVREVCEEAKAQNKNYQGYVWYGGGNRYPSYPWMFKVWSQGASIVQDDGTVLFNSEAGRKALRWQVQLIEEGLVPDVTQYGQGGPEDLFLGNRVVSYVGGSKMIPKALEAFGSEGYQLGLPAKAEGGTHATYLGTDCICINRFAPAPKKRAAMIYFDGARSAVAGAREFSEEGNMPANTQAWDHEFVQGVPFTEITKQAIQNAQAELWPSQIETIEVLVTQLQRAWSGQASTEEALEAAQQEVDNILEQN